MAWFSQLLIAIDRGEYRHAAEAQRQLARLGWSVNPRKHRRPAPGREVGHEG